MKQNIIESVFDIEAVNGQGVFEGYASVFDHTDLVHDRVAKGAFKNSLASHKAKSTLPAMLWQHDTTEPIGKWIDIFENSHGLFVRGKLFIDDIPRARQAYSLMREEALTGLSIGFKARESYRDAEGGERVLTDIDLLEVSLVTFPALEAARISHVKQILRKGDLPDLRTTEAFLREAGFSRKQAKGFIAAGYKSLGPRDAGFETDISKNIDVMAIKHLTQKLKGLITT